MIAVDTSALLAIIGEEADGDACLAAIRADGEAVMSAGSMTEAMIVSTGLDLRDQTMRLVEQLRIEVMPVDVAAARRIGEIYQRWGKGFHRASLNFGDCFAYEVAERLDCPLLYIGDDFAKTDIRSAL